MPIFRVNVYARTTKAVNYRHRGGATTVDFRRTGLMPQVEGHAKVDGKAGRLAISAELTHMLPASSFGGQYFTYVLWAITLEGRAVNLGEILPGDNGKDKIDVTTDLQAFGLIVTAEPYYSVTHPSNKVVAENILRQETKGFEEPIDARFDVLEGAQYTIDVPADQLPATQLIRKCRWICSKLATPLPLLRQQEQSSMHPTVWRKPRTCAKGRRLPATQAGPHSIGTAARGATQMAEDARVLTLRRKEQERIDAERRAHEEAQAKAEADARLAQEQAAQAKAQADEDARRRAREPSRRKPKLSASKPLR